MSGNREPFARCWVCPDRCPIGDCQRDVLAPYRDELDAHIAELMQDPEYAAAPKRALDEMGDADGGDA